MIENKIIDSIMEQAQVFASTWALIDTRFDEGTMLVRAESEKDKLELMNRRVMAPNIEVASVPNDVWHKHPNANTNTGGWYKESEIHKDII